MIKPRARAAPMLCVLRNTLWMLGGQVEISHTDIVLGALWVWVGGQDLCRLHRASLLPHSPPAHCLLLHSPPWHPPQPLLRTDDLWSLDLNKLDCWRCVKENAVGEEAFRELSSDEWETGSDEED